MKKLYFLLLLAAAQITTSAKEVIYLKNGSIIKGDIVEIVPNKTLTVETADGSSFVCNYDDIDKITREKTENNEVIAKKSEDNEALATPKIKDNSSPLKRGYSGDVSSGFFAGEVWGADILTTHGFRFNPKLFVGLGTGLRFTDFAESFSIPIFVNFRYDVLNNKISPFFAIKSGVNINLEHSFATGFYGAFDAGCRFGHFYVSTGFETARDGDECYYGYYRHGGYYDPSHGNDTYDYDFQAINFALRFGFIF
ncbi:MAG: hypothetical protein K6G31_05360 [Paludibacteraceae bacterium]|nr:hypothetical protein [Paludibacteraceae bacterium]